jgi:hypothetical protein
MLWAWPRGTLPRIRHNKCSDTPSRIDHEELSLPLSKIVDQALLIRSEFREGEFEPRADLVSVEHEG